MESFKDEKREIRKQLRLAMNGVISTSMREKGIVYKLNFGVPYPEIKEIARKHKPNGELAAALWKEDIREFKILATFLQPAEKLPLKRNVGSRRFLIWRSRSIVAGTCSFICLIWRTSRLIWLLIRKMSSLARSPFLLGPRISSEVVACLLWF